jgi:cytidyltransferase-like protein
MTAGKPKKRGVFPGQFDPITNGHLDVIRRGVHLFDELIVAVGVNPEKREMFSLDDRIEMIRSLLVDQPTVKVRKYTGLTVDFVRWGQQPCSEGSETCRTCATSSSWRWPTAPSEGSRRSSS